MNSVLSLIIMLSQNSLEKDSTYILCQYIINNISNMKDITITKLAEDCYISTTTVIKFCKLLGFNSFTTFKKNLVSGVQIRKLQLIEKYEEITIDDYFKNLNHLVKDHLDKKEFIETIDLCIQHIHNNKKIHIYGAIFPLALTLSFMEDMIIMGIPVELHQLNYHDDDYHEEDGINMIIAISGRFMIFHKNLYKKLSAKGNKTILISQNIHEDNHMLVNIPVPTTCNYDYNEMTLLMILDMIKCRYYNKYM